MKDLFNSDKNKQTPYKVPNDYFKELPMRINERIEKPSFRYTWFNRIEFKLAISVIMMVLLAGISVYYFNSGTVSYNADSLLTNVPQQTILDYLETEPLHNDEIFSMIDHDLYADVSLPDDLTIYEDDLYLFYSDDDDFGL